MPPGEILVQEKNKNYRQAGLLWLVILAGAVLTFSVTRETIRFAEQQAFSDFNTSAELYAGRVEAELQAGLTAAQDIYSFYKDSDGVSRETFVRLVRTNSNLNENRQFVALAYAVSKENEAKFIESLQQIYGGEFNVREPASSGAQQNNLRRFPLLYISTANEAKRERLLGLNIGAVEKLNAFLENTLKLGEQSAVFIPAFPELGSDMNGQVLLANPFVNKAGNVGLIVQLVDFQKLVDSVNDKLIYPRKKLYLQARSKQGVGGFEIEFGETADASEIGEIMPHSRPFVLGAGDWTITITPKSGAYPVDYSTAAITASVCILLTGLFYFIVWSQLRRARRVADIVNRRTRALKEAHDELEEHYKLLQNLNKDVEESRRGAELANRAKSEFLATMSHELRTPLNAILGFSQLLSEQALGPVGDTRYIEYAKDIHSSGSHLLSLINDILDLAKLEAGKIHIEKNAISTRLLTERVVTLLGQQATDKGIELCAEFDDNMPDSILGDELRLRQILINLCTNAIKFTQEGMVTARLFSKPFKNGRQGWVLEVQDTGIGIPEEKQSTLFDRFTQVDAALSRRHGGVGLGLAICRELVDRMDGSISVRSIVSVGTTIRVHLPLEEATADDIDNEMII